MKQSATTKAALPERIHIDGLNARLIIGTPDKATCSTATFAAELVLRWNRYGQAVRIIDDMVRLYESKWSDEPPELIAARNFLAQLERPA